MRSFSQRGQGGPDMSATTISEASLLKTIIRLWPYIWPKGRRDLEIRVLIVFVLLFISKGFNALTPYAYKWATDALSEKGADALATVGQRQAV